MSTPMESSKPPQSDSALEEVTGDLLRALARQEVLERCCSGLEGELLRAKTRSEAFRLRVQRVVEKIDEDVSGYVVEPVQHYRDLLIEAMGEDAPDKP